MPFRFSRDGVAFSGKGPEMFAGAVRAEFELSAEGEQIIDALHGALGGSIQLYDGERQKHHHLARPLDLQSLSEDWEVDLSRSCHLRAPVTERWTLIVSSRESLHPDAPSLIKWAAAKLERHVPDRTNVAT